jgi:hypothetical protein
MDSHILEGLTLRLEAAERGLRAARRAMWTGSILVAAAIGGGAWWVASHLPTGAAAETVEAQHFVVRDAQGQARAVLESSEGGSTQLVFLRDPIAGDGWRGRANAGPYSFGVRSISARSQVMLSDRDGTNFQLTTDNLSFDSTGTTRLLLGADQRGARIWLADSTGSMQLLNAGLLADAAAKLSPKPSPAPKHRRRH